MTYYPGPIAYIIPSVALTVCIIVLLWLVAFYKKVQRTLQWWNYRQSVQLYLEAEKIRNGLLQESFVIRRDLELALADDAGGSKQVLPDWLETIETMHHSLEELSDHLSSPYLDDNLPLAVRYLLDQWQTNHPNINAKIHLPINWCHESIEQNRIILTTIDELLRIVLLQSVMQVSLIVDFKQQGHIHELTILFSTPDASALAFQKHREELAYLRQSFKFFTSGTCYSQRKDSTLTWYFRWRVQPDSLKPGLLFERK